MSQHKETPTGDATPHHDPGDESEATSAEASGAQNDTEDPSHEASGSEHVEAAQPLDQQEDEPEAARESGEEGEPQREEGSELFVSPDQEGDDPDGEGEPEVVVDLDAEGALRQELEAMTAERDDFKARLLRAVADMENFRKRKERERQETVKFGAEKVVLDLLPAIDNLERALEHAEKSQDQSSIVDGVSMVQRQLSTALEKHGIRSFTATGERFDPQLHEAIQQVETSEHETGVVMQEYQKGYMIHDRLLRPAMTVVAKHVPPQQEGVRVADDAPTEADVLDQEQPTTEVIEVSAQDDEPPVIEINQSGPSKEESSESGA